MWVVKVCHAAPTLERACGERDLHVSDGGYKRPIVTPWATVPKRANSSELRDRVMQEEDVHCQWAEGSILPDDSISGRPMRLCTSRLEYGRSTLYGCSISIKSCRLVLDYLFSNIGESLVKQLCQIRLLDLLLSSIPARFTYPLPIRPE